MKNRIYIPIIIILGSIFFIDTLSAQHTAFLGMTEGSGTGGAGTIFSFDPLTGRDTTLYNFSAIHGVVDGAFPYGNLCYNPDNGLYYGMTSSGYDSSGHNNGGTIFSFDLSTNTEAVVWTFKLPDTLNGWSPRGDLVYDTLHRLFYGMTLYGGSSKGANRTGLGTIFSFNPITNSLVTDWRFQGGADGANPFGNLVYDPDNGLYYGMTSKGGTSSYDSIGTIISFNPSTNTESVVHSFIASDGASPHGNLVYHTNNRLFYGMTCCGGATPQTGTIGGNVFSFDPATGRDSSLWTIFSNAQPFGDLVYDSINGLFYGMTQSGSGCSNPGYGTIFSFNPVTNAPTSSEWNFNCQSVTESAANPHGNLVKDPDNGLYYGMTLNSALGFGQGYIISFNPSTNWVTDIVAVNSAYGSLVRYIVANTTTGIINGNEIHDTLYIYPNPTTGKFKLVLPSGAEDISISNTLGQIRYSANLHGETEINAYLDESGVYFVRVSIPDYTITQKMVICK